MKKIIVTGATGMIGAFLTRLAAMQGIEVLAVIRPGSSKRANVPKHPNVKIIECDLSDLSGLPPQMGDDGVLFHLAWDKTYGNGRDDVAAQMKNIQYTLDAVELAKRSGCSAFIGAGSQAEYGRIADGMLSPFLPVDPQTGYGIAKYTAGALSRILCRQYGIRHCWGRILSVYGPMDNPYTLISYCVESFLRGQAPALTNCDQIWDYIYGADAARAFLAIGESGKDGSIYCIGSGKAQALKRYIETIRDSIDTKLKIGFGERDYYPNQVMRMQADIGNLTQDTGFFPDTPFEEGIKHAIEWQKKEMENEKN